MADYEAVTTFRAKPVPTLGQADMTNLRRASVTGRDVRAAHRSASLSFARLMRDNCLAEISQNRLRPLLDFRGFLLTFQFPQNYGIIFQNQARRPVSVSK